MIRNLFNMRIRVTQFACLLAVCNVALNALSENWSQFRGNATSATRPSKMRQPLAIPTLPPTATVFEFSRNGVTARIKASRSRMVSASMIATRAPDAALIPALAASALHLPLSLSITTRPG